MNANVNLIKLQKNIYFITLFSSFFGASFFSFNILGLNLLPYRIFLLFNMLLMLYTFKNSYLLMKNSNVKLYILFYLFWLAYSIVGINWSYDQVNAIQYTVYLFIYNIMTIQAIVYINILKDLVYILYIWIIVLISFLLIGMWEILTGLHLSISGYSNLDYVLNTPTAVFHNPNDYATFLAISMPFLLSLIQYINKYRIKYFLIFIFFMLLVNVFMTMSRANSVSILLVIFIWFIFFLQIKKKMLYFLFCLLWVFLFYVFMQDVFLKVVLSSVEQFQSLFDVDKFNLNDSNIVRVNLIKNCFSFFLQSYGFGVGPGNSEFWMENYSQYDTMGILNPHNWWFELLVNYGILIFLTYIFFYCSIIYQLFKAYKYFKNNKEEKIIAQSLVLAMVTFLLSSTSSSSVMGFMPQWILLLYGVAFINYYSKKKQNAYINNSI